MSLGDLRWPCSINRSIILVLATIQAEIVTDSNLGLPFRDLTNTDVELEEAISGLSNESAQ